MSECRHIVQGVLLGEQRVSYRQGLDQPDIHTIHLLQGKGVIEKRLFAHDGIQLPLHQVRRYTLGFRELPAIERAQLGESLLRKTDSGATIRAGLRRELALQAVLRFAREIAGRGAEVGIPADPLGREVSEKIVEAF